jgi:hypothetical protein
VDFQLEKKKWNKKKEKEKAKTEFFFFDSAIFHQDQVEEVVMTMLMEKNIRVSAHLTRKFSLPLFSFD